QELPVRREGNGVDPADVRPEGRPVLAGGDIHELDGRVLVADGQGPAGRRGQRLAVRTEGQLRLPSVMALQGRQPLARGGGPQFAGACPAATRQDLAVRGQGDHAADGASLVVDDGTVGRPAARGGEPGQRQHQEPAAPPAARRATMLSRHWGLLHQWSGPSPSTTRPASVVASYLGVLLTRT